MLSQKQIKGFQKHILSWYAKNKRELPWRNTQDPYKILVSEVMSQQTQILRVVPKYEAWLLAFPTIQDLANASTRDVLMHWSGLGYNRRALYLQKCAKEIVQTYNGQFPQTEKELLSLPSVGKYTARAILSFAYNKPVAVVDTNIKKVILTQLGLKKVLSEKEIEEIAEQILPNNKAKDWNQALMDYSSIMLKKEKIPIPKQSKFIDSDRFYRGQIIKLLIENQNTSIFHVHKLFPVLTDTRLKKILSSLEKDNLVTMNGNLLTLP